MKEEGGIFMGEKIYQTMKSAGIVSLVMGILVIVAGVAAGVTIIVNGAKLLKHKSGLLF
jgi:hypothetical protein